MIEAEEAILALLAERGAGATICPSEAAKRIDANDWRDRMTEVHAATDSLAARKRITLSWKGIPLNARHGPYRIGNAGQ